MQILKDRIVKDGKVLKGNVLKVDGFLNHQLDHELLYKIGREFFRRFGHCGVTKLLTIESSGIGVACVTAQFFAVPTLFAKKSKSSNLSDELYLSKVHSFTHDVDNTVLVSKSYLSANDRVLIIDDFMAHGCAAEGLIDIVKQAGATLIGVGICIEKGYQHGGDRIRESGVEVYSLAIIDSMDAEGNIVFRE